MPRWHDARPPIVVDREVLSARQTDATQGHAALLPVMARDVMAAAATPAASLDLVAVTVGPGSFTGIRAGLALAHGIALAAGVPVVGVTVGEALANSLPFLAARQLWVAIDSRRGRVFLERERQRGRDAARCAAGAGRAGWPWRAMRRSRSRPGWPRATPT